MIHDPPMPIVHNDEEKSEICISTYTPIATLFAYNVASMTFISEVGDMCY
jgi:hypothetical protein